VDTTVIVRVSTTVVASGASGDGIPERYAVTIGDVEFDNNGGGLLTDAEQSDAPSANRSHGIDGDGLSVVDVLVVESSEV
jgi:hypothetical protein